jgi:hypothetical protein
MFTGRSRSGAVTSAKVTIDVSSRQWLFLRCHPLSATTPISLSRCLTSVARQISDPFRLRLDLYLFSADSVVISKVTTTTEEIPQSFHIDLSCSLWTHYPHTSRSNRISSLPSLKSSLLGYLIGFSPLPRKTRLDQQHFRFLHISACSHADLCSV